MQLTREVVMRYLALSGVAATVALWLAGGAWAEPAGQTANAERAAVATPGAAPGVPPVAAPKNILERAAEEVKTQVAAAEKLLKLSEEEMAKPENRRDARRASALKLNAAQTYLRAAQKAKSYTPRLKEEDRQAFLSEYERPNREKAVALLLELAKAAMDKNDLRTALALYGEVLKIDPGNATAQAAAKKLTEEIKTAKSGGSTGGGSNDEIKNYQRSYRHDWSGTGTDWGRIGRGPYW